MIEPEQDNGQAYGDENCPEIKIEGMAPPPGPVDSAEGVGFGNLPNQVHRKSVKKGFEFTLMVVGESGLGKSTLISSLFRKEELKQSGAADKHVNAEKIPQTVEIATRTVVIEEKAVKLRLTVVDTPGFGDMLDNTDCYKTISRYIDEKFEQYLKDESGLNRRNIVDSRVHCCFYFVNPSCHGLRPIDVEFMRNLCSKVNIVPVIAKSDTLTKTEVANMKKKVLEDLEMHKISIYKIPDAAAESDEEDEEYIEQNRQLRQGMPFAVVGSNIEVEAKGRVVRGRKYPWGIVELDNPDHCDFKMLQTMLITHMQDLQEVTHDVHYESFRAKKLSMPGSELSSAPAVTLQEEKKLAEKDKMLQEKENELKKMQEKLARMQAEVEEAKRSTSSLSSVGSAAAPAPPSTAPPPIPSARPGPGAAGYSSTLNYSSSFNRSALLSNSAAQNPNAPKTTTIK